MGTQTAYALRSRKPFRKRPIRWSRIADKAFPYIMLAAPFLLVLGLIAYPIYLTFNMSIRDGRAMSLGAISEQALTLSNYTEVLTDPAVHRSLWITAVYTGISTLFVFLLGLGTAMLLNKRLPARRVFRTLILLPWAVPGAVASVVFLFMFDGGYGIINWAIRSLGVGEGTAWYSNPDTALVAVIVPTVWKGYPFLTIIILAALQSIPDELYEAARVDGASPPAQFFYITWPGIRGASVLGVILSGLWVFHMFDLIFPLTGGGPNGATETWAIMIYNQAFGFFQPGTAGALGILATLLAVAVVASIFPLMRKQFF